MLECDKLQVLNLTFSAFWTGDVCLSLQKSVLEAYHASAASNLCN